MAFFETSTDAYACNLTSGSTDNIKLRHYNAYELMIYTEPCNK